METQVISEATARYTRHSMPTGTRRKPVFLLGHARSGTTWLANIIASCPDVLYRHEPLSKNVLSEAGWSLFREANNGVSDSINFDGIFQEISTPHPLTHRPPFFSKTFFKYPAAAQWLAWMSTRFSGRLTPLFLRMSSLRDAADFVLLVKDGWSKGIGRLAAVTGASVVLLVRHPCAVVASHLRGNRLGLMRSAEQNCEEIVEKAKELSTHLEIEPDSIRKEPAHVKLAYAWLFTNFELMSYLREDSSGNVTVAVYEEFCKDPLSNTRALFDRLGLELTAPTLRYLKTTTTPSRIDRIKSLCRGKHSFFDVSRRSDLKIDDPQAELPTRMAEDVMRVASKLPWHGLRSEEGPHRRKSQFLNGAGWQYK